MKYLSLVQNEVYQVYRNSQIDVDLQLQLTKMTNSQNEVLTKLKSIPNDVHPAMGIHHGGSISIWENLKMDGSQSCWKSIWELHNGCKPQKSKHQFGICF